MSPFKESAEAKKADQTRHMQMARQGYLIMREGATMPERLIRRGNIQRKKDVGLPNVVYISQPSRAERKANRLKWHRNRS